jgi:aspartokinase
MSIANEVRLYLKNRPYILEALEKDIVNLSKLTRKIQEELKIENFHAVKAALRRFSQEARKLKYKREEKVLELLRKSSLAIYEGNSIVITDEPIQIKERVRVKLEGNYVYLLEKSELPRFEKSMLRKNENCTTIVIRSPEEIENTPGVVAFLTSLLTEQNINVLEFISCWTDTIIVVDRKDSLKAYEVLSNVIS